MKKFDEETFVPDKNTDWGNICYTEELSENFMRKYKDKVNWSSVSYRQDLSEDFIREFQDRIDWWWILRTQNLSESFIREFKNKIDWNVISAYQELSEDFIKEFNLTSYKHLGLKPINWKVSNDNIKILTVNYDKKQSDIEKYFDFGQSIRDIII